jgi:hypothetical protein
MICPLFTGSERERDKHTLFTNRREKESERVREIEGERGRERE